MITIEIAPTLTGAPAAGILGQPYTHAFTVTGQPIPVTVTLTAGTLPLGLTLTEAGVLPGTPTEAGTFAVTFTASNGVGTPATLTISETPAPLRQVHSDRSEISAPDPPIFTRNK